MSKPFLELTKAMQTLTDLNTKLLKTVTENVPRSKYDRKVTAEIENVL